MTIAAATVNSGPNSPMPLIIVAIAALFVVASRAIARGTTAGIRIARWAATLLPDENERFADEWEADVWAASDGGKHQVRAFLWGLGTVQAAVRGSQARSLVYKCFGNSNSDPVIVALVVGAAAGTSALLLDGSQSGVSVGLTLGVLAGMSVASKLDLTAALYAACAFAVTSGLGVGLLVGIGIDVMAGATAGIAAFVSVGSILLTIVGLPSLLNQLRHRFATQPSDVGG